ncbi:MAG TPA: SurA N-terminal domain-containing protein [Cyclobacteriaceae bacterium]|nr:SurA N-terminal domain-containing protein [Cyclobacteriaceae bacterium]
MALIGTLRNKMGTWVVAFVFIAIAAFTLNDIFGNNSILLGDNNVGEIAGEKISLEEFQAAVQEREINYRLTFGRAPGERENPLLQEQAWEMLIAKYAIEQQYDKLGIKVTTDEVKDMVWGKNIEPSLKSTPIFLNEAGQFDNNRVLQYLQYVNALPPTHEDRYRWESFQANLAPARIRIKYENMMIRSENVTRAEAEREYHVQNDVAEVKYLFVPFYAVGDSAAAPEDRALREYYNQNKERYRTDPIASLSYVTFPVLPSAADSAAIRDEMAQLAAEFANADNDSLFAITNSDAPDAFARYTPNDLPPYINPDSLVEGNVIGPFVDGNAYRVAKISSITEDTIFTARARHILVRWTDETDAAKQAARTKAEGILRELRGGADFAAKAREVSEDPGSAARGGDLGWFSTGDMVKPFQDAVFGATRPGLINRVVESQFGYHIIDVTDVKDNTAYWIATLSEEISPGDASINEALRKAESFQLEVRDLASFQQEASSLGLNVLEAKNVGVGDRRIGILGNARRVVQWLFNDASVGDVSEVFDLNGEFVVAVMTDKVKKGYKPFEMVKDEITPIVANKNRAKIIQDRLNKLEGTLEEIANAFGPEATVHTSSDLRLNSTTLPGISFDPTALGTAFRLSDGGRSKPFQGENGVIIMETIATTIAPAIADYGLYKTQLEQARANRTSFSIADAIKESANIEDRRYKYY